MHKKPLLKLILIIITLFLFSCLSIPEEVNSNTENQKVIPLEFYGLKAGESLAPGTIPQIEAVSGYLSEQLTKSPFYSIVLDRQERVLTGIISKIEGKYQLSLNMFKYETAELETTVTVRFLSLSEFDYAVDLAVAKLEGREIKIGTKSQDLYDFDIAAGNSGVELTFHIPEIPEAEKDDDLRRISGMLKEQLDQADYRLNQGDYGEAETIYHDFIRKFDAGINSRYREQLAPVRNYAENQKNQAGSLKMHQQWNDRMKAVADQFNFSGDPEKAYHQLDLLRKEILKQQGSFGVNEQHYDYLISQRESLEDLRAGLMRACLDLKAAEAQILLQDEQFFSGWSIIHNAKIELLEEGMQDALSHYLNEIENAESRIKTVCDDMLAAHRKEFLYNTSYYGFNGDITSLRSSFKEYARLLQQAPYDITIYALEYNKMKAEYNSLLEKGYNSSDITPYVKPNPERASLLMYALKEWGIDNILENPRLLDLLEEHSFQYWQERKDHYTAVEFSRSASDIFDRIGTSNFGSYWRPGRSIDGIAGWREVTLRRMAQVNPARFSAITNKLLATAKNNNSFRNYRDFKEPLSSEYRDFISSYNRILPELTAPSRVYTFRDIDAMGLPYIVCTEHWSLSEKGSKYRSKINIIRLTERGWNIIPVDSFNSRSHSLRNIIISDNDGDEGIFLYYSQDTSGNGYHIAGNRVSRL